MTRGYVTFELAGATFAVRVDEVREIVRVASADLLPGGEHTLAGRELGLLDVRRRTIPVLDLRTGAGCDAEAILPRRRPLAGLVVDRVTAVLPPGELVPQEAEQRALPSYAVGVLRPAAGGPPVLLVALPEVAQADSLPGEEPALGTPILTEEVVCQARNRPWGTRLRKAIPDSNAVPDARLHARDRSTAPPERRELPS